jgi:hypothetical protein
MQTAKTPCNNSETDTLRTNKPTQARIESKVKT